jgi:CubicO group peptidase (beta-lactamase class C family)
VERLSSAHAVIAAAIDDRAFPAAVVEVGNRHEVLCRDAQGRLSQEPEAPLTREDSVFDLASLTKVIATTTLVMTLAEEGRLRLSDPVSRWLPDWRGRDRAQATVEDLLAHTAGLTAWAPLYRESKGRVEMEAAICELPLEYRPRSQAVYSDLGFILLGFIVEDAGGAPLDEQFATVRNRMGPDAASSPSGFARQPGAGYGEPLSFTPPPSWRHLIAPTEVDPWRGRLLVGEVHDENAWALGGVAGHAGLFGTAGAVGCFARGMLDLRLGGSASAGLVRPETVARFTRRGKVPGSSRALGWDTMLPGSSCGSRMSREAFGHTGFTGTSLWIDPASDVYVVLLSNRVNPSRVNDRIRNVRPALHDAVMEDLARSGGRRPGSR